MLKTINNPMLSHNKYTCLYSNTGNITTFLHLIIESYKEVIDKLKIIKAISIGFGLENYLK